ncbi:MAG: hypothetical protein Q7R78_01985 [bacterium]|nr:hypothetical protein [bacterium]
MKKYINNAIALILLAEGIYFLYNFVLIFTQIISTFDYSANTMYAYGVYIITMILFILAGIGLLRYKKWAIICGWIALILPQILKLIEPLSRIPLRDNYIILLINILVLIYISTQWRKLKTD